jgi:predicted transcriptional regulator
MAQNPPHDIRDGEMNIVRGLVQMGAKPNVARVLVFLARNPGATSAAIERGTGIRQTNVSVAMMQPVQQGWIRYQTIPPSHKGRPVKLYELAKPLTEIIQYLQQNQEDQINPKLSSLRKMSHHRG